MARKMEKIPVVIEFTEGYEKRFTEEILKIYEKRRKREQTENKLFVDCSA